VEQTEITKQSDLKIYIYIFNFEILNDFKENLSGSSVYV